MKYLLVPGRHHLLTNFQFDYISEALKKEKIGSIVFAVTSANHSNTRRNPLPLYQRAMALHEFSSELPASSYVFDIDDVGSLKNFADYTAKRIKNRSEGKVDLKPENTVVVSSTPEVIEQYNKAGFKVLTGEYDKEEKKYTEIIPWDIVEDVGKNKKELFADMAHPASKRLWKIYNVDDKVKVLFNDKMIGDDGDLTETRDYNSYTRLMDENAELKFKDTIPFIMPGRIGDIGCAVGSWIKLACADDRFRESDFFGVEISRQLYEICEQRKENGEFENPFVFFSRKNAVSGLVFEPNSMNTIHTSSITHEIESYAGRENLLQFIKNRYEELAEGGVWINRDVVGPESKKETVYMKLKLNTENGRISKWKKKIKERAELEKYLNELSTFGKFLRFAQDFREEEGYKLAYKIETLDKGKPDSFPVSHFPKCAWDEHQNGSRSADKYSAHPVSKAHSFFSKAEDEWNNVDNENYIKLKLADACEFMSKKDYTNNWQSEMHETFCFWDFNEWKSEMENAGFKVRKESRAFANEWIVDNRYRGKAELFKMENGKLVKMDYPVTNMILVGEK